MKTEVGSGISGKKPGKEKLNPEELELLRVLKCALAGEEFLPDPGVDLKKVLNIADRHGVLSLLYGVFPESAITWEEEKYLESSARRTVLQSYRLLFLTKYVVNLLSGQGIPCVVLKGVSAAAYYPTPELRKSGDVDVLVDSRVSRKKLDQVMRSGGFVPAEEQHGVHHVVYQQDGIHVEVHRMAVEPIARYAVNRAVKKKKREWLNHTRRKETMGIRLPVLDRPYQAYHYLLHMLQHFMHSGFGVKLLCDWVEIWKKPWSRKEKETFLKLTKDTRIRGFAGTVTGACVVYLGLPEQKMAFLHPDTRRADIFLRELFDSEEFGDASAERIVMLQRPSVTGYLREFHHQMHRNYPTLGRVFPLWPGLWLLTLIRFLWNNRTIRHVTLGDMLASAGRRSRIMDEIQVFDR